MKYHITITPETTNLLLGALEQKLEKISLENSDLVTELKTAQNKIKSDAEVMETYITLNGNLIEENKKLSHELTDLKKKFGEIDIEGEKLKNQKLEEKLESFRLGRDKERELNKGFVIEILKTFGIAVSEEISTLIGERDYFKAAAKINAEIKKEAKRIAATKTERKG
ncbi:MAG: hypothetical protein ACRCX2_17800 [Paraclostridium sp.]